MIDDRRERRARRLALAEAEPEDEQRDDDDPAADAEQAAEEARASVPIAAQRRRVRRGRMRGILEVMSAAATLAEALAPLRADPARAGILLDIDGTLAPIVRHADDAHVPEPTRAQLIAVAKRYAVVGCISGRQAQVARRIVSLGTIAYVGNHGSELLRRGRQRGRDRPRDRRARARPCARFAADVYTTELQRLRVRAEDKRAIAALSLARRARRGRRRGRRARRRRRAPRRRPRTSTGGARCSRCARRSRSTRAAACAACSAAATSRRRSTSATTATDLDAFDGLRELVDEGELGAAVCVGVRSDETPPELEQAADVLVDGPVGVRELLTALLDVSRRCGSSTSCAPRSCSAPARRRRSPP